MTGDRPSAGGGTGQQSAAGAIVRGAVGHAFALALAGYFFLPPIIPLQPIVAFAADAGLKLQQADVPKFLAAVGALLGLVTGSIGGWLDRRRRLRRMAQLASVAAGTGGKYNAQPGAALGDWLRSYFHNSRAVAATNELRFEADGVRIADAHVEYFRGTGSSSNSRPLHPTDQTVACLDAGDLALPDFTLQPEGPLVNTLTRIVGVEDIDFPAQPDFSRKYHLSAVHAEHTRRLFDSSLLAALVRTDGLHIRSQGGGIVLYRPRQMVDSADLKRFTTEALTILQLFRRSAESLAFPAPPAPATGAGIKAVAEAMPGLMGRMVRDQLFVRADVEAFLQQAPPRKIPDKIHKLVLAGGFDFSRMMGLVLLTWGVVSTLIIMNQQPADAASAAGRTMLVTGLLFGALGAWILFSSVRSRYGQTALLRSGHIGSARILNLDATGLEIEGEKQYLMTVEFQALGRAVTATSRIRGDAVFRARRLMEDGKPAVILYDPRNEKRILYTDSLLHVSPEYEL